MKSDYAMVLEKLKKENALDLGSYFLYHPYSPVPEASYGHLAEPLRKFVKGIPPTSTSCRERWDARPNLSSGMR